MRREIKFILVIAIFFLATGSTYAEEWIIDESGKVPSNVGGWGPGNQCKQAAIDIDGEVGHPLTVRGPHASCKTDEEYSHSWNLYPEVISGTLPPGLAINRDSSIGGIPTERGHWIVTMKASNIHDVCGVPVSSPSFTQQLRFHITGSGKVVE